MPPASTATMADAALPEPTLDPAVPIQDQIAAEPGERPILTAIAKADAAMREVAAVKLAEVAQQLPADAVLDLLLVGKVDERAVADALALAEDFALEVGLPAIDEISRHAEREGRRVAKVVRA